jgi:ribose 5-phosphate isomerase B
MTRLHNDANMLSLGAGIVGPLLAEAITEAFIDTEFSGAQRHARRIRQIESENN